LNTLWDIVILRVLKSYVVTLLFGSWQWLYFTGQCSNTFLVW